MEYIFGCEQIRALTSSISGCTAVDKEANQSLVTFPNGDCDNSEVFSDVVSRFRSRRSRTAKDWCDFTTELNGQILGVRGKLRATTAVLLEGDPWMHWQAPPDDLNNRMRDVLKHLASKRMEPCGIAATFPAIILLHPFANGNARTAFELMKVLNSIHGVVHMSRVDAFIRLIQSERLAVIDALSQIRLSGDVSAYMAIAGSTLFKS